MVAQVVIPRRRVTTLAQFDGRALRVALRDLCSRARCVGHGVVPDSSLLVEGAVAQLRVPPAGRARVEAALVGAQVWLVRDIGLGFGPVPRAGPEGPWPQGRRP